MNMRDLFLPKNFGERWKENKTWTKLQNIEEGKRQKYDQVYWDSRINQKDLEVYD